MRKKKERRQFSPVRLDMTPMIDVVFLLLIFFLVTTRQEDILSHFNVTRPGHVEAADELLPPLTVQVLRNGIQVNGAPMTLAALDREVSRLRAKDTMIRVACAPDSEHASLVKVLDTCSKAGMQRVAVLSLAAKEQSAP